MFIGILVTIAQSNATTAKNSFLNANRSLRNLPANSTSILRTKSFSTCLKTTSQFANCQKSKEENTSLGEPLPDCSRKRIPVQSARGLEYIEGELSKSCLCCLTYDSKPVFYPKVSVKFSCKRPLGVVGFFLNQN